MAAVKGDGGDVTIGSSALEVIEWSGDLEQDIIDITNVASGGWDEVILGNSRLSGSAKAIWDATINADAPPFALVKPQGVAAMTLGIGTGGGTYSGAFAISKLSITNATGKAVEYSFDFTSSGAVAYTAPTPP